MTRPLKTSLVFGVNGSGILAVSRGMLAARIVHGLLAPFSFLSDTTMIVSVRETPWPERASEPSRRTLRTLSGPGSIVCGWPIAAQTEGGTSDARPMPMSSSDVRPDRAGDS